MGEKVYRLLAKRVAVGKGICLQNVCKPNQISIVTEEHM